MSALNDDNVKKKNDSHSAFPRWLKPALKSRRTLKTWVRCCLVLAACMVLLVDSKTGASMGQAGFFAAILSTMLPPSMALSLFVIAGLTLIIGMLLGWAWGCIAMVAALSVRDPALLRQQQQAAQRSIVAGVPPALQLQSLVFHGQFLDPRSSAVYGVFLFIATFALGTVRAFAPKLALLSIFGTIVVDVMCSYGPLFPTAQYTLAKLFVIPSLYYIAIAIASLVLVFPESLNHVWLHILGEGVLQPISDIIDTQSGVLNSRPSDQPEWSTHVQSGRGLRRQLIAGVQGLLGQAGFVDLEISVGRLGPGDVKLISDQLQDLASRASGLLSFAMFVDDSNTQDKAEETLLQNKERHETSRTTNLRRRVRERELRFGHNLEILVPILGQSSQELREASKNGINATKDWFHDCNSGRWTGFFSKVNKDRVAERRSTLATSLADLERALDNFQKVERRKLTSPYAHEQFFDLATGKLLEALRQNPHGPNMFAARSLYICFVFCDTLVAFAQCLQTLLKFIVVLDTKRGSPRIWFPSGFGKLSRKILSRSDVGQVSPAIGSTENPDEDERAVEEDSDDKTVTDEFKSKHYTARNPDALAPTTGFGRFGLKLGALIAFFRSAEGVFALRHAVVSVALWIPAVANPSSAWFTYSNKGLWALIMAQTGMAVYAGDQIFGFVIRIIGTLAGLLLGMTTWYIAAGRGNGNPYGVVVATTIMTAPLSFLRIAGPPQYATAWVMPAVTIVFVVGYSWVDTHFVTVSTNSGVGVTLGWKRALLVIIGFTAGFIVMLFPRLTSARHISKTWFLTVATSDSVVL